jgi:hypothetical protein
MNGGKNCRVKIGHVSFENLQNFKHLGTAVKIKVAFTHTRIAD